MRGISTGSILRRLRMSYPSEREQSEKLTSEGKKRMNNRLHTRCCFSPIFPHYTLEYEKCVTLVAKAKTSSSCLEA